MPNTTVPIMGNGSPSTPVTVDLTSFVNVTRIEIVNITDSNGIGWDDFTFTPGIPVELESFDMD